MNLGYEDSCLLEKVVKLFSPSKMLVKCLSVDLACYIFMRLCCSVAGCLTSRTPTLCVTATVGKWFWAIVSSSQLLMLLWSPTVDT